MTLVTNGSTIAKLLSVYDLWDVKKKKFQSTEYEFKPQMRLIFELQEFEKDTKDGKKTPVTAKLDITKYSSDASTAYTIASAIWFDIAWLTQDQVLDAFIDNMWWALMLEVENAEWAGREYAKITGGYTKIPNMIKDKVTPLFNDSVSFKFDSKWEDKFSELPDYLKDWYKTNSRTYQEKTLLVSEEEEDMSLPFN